MTNPTLQEIFKQLHAKSNLDVYATPELEVMELVRRLEQHEQEAIQAISAAIDSIIGADDIPGDMATGSPEEAKNKLRVQQKANLKAFLGGGNG